MYSQFGVLCSESALYQAWNEVKSKGSAGGVDGVSIEQFNKDKFSQIRQIREELKTGKWKPQPYLQIAIPKRKDPKEKRVLGMAVIKDKIVQQAIRHIVDRIVISLIQKGQDLEVRNGTDKFKPYVAKW